MPIRPFSARRPDHFIAMSHPPRAKRRRSGRSRSGLWPANVTLMGLAVACGLLTVYPAVAQAPEPTGAEQEPTLLDAENVVYDQEKGVVTATGAVELSQGRRTARADKMTYDRNTKIVTASGNVRLVEPSGDIVFADYAELTDDMRDAFVEHVKVLMTDNGRMVGNEGERRGGRLFRLNRGVYSPCELCADDPQRAPLWQVRAARVVHDKEEQEVRYRDVFLEMFGVPVVYTPYLSHPDPTVDRRSGFLAPNYGTTKDLGTFVTTHYYIDIAPDQDATMELGYTAKQGPIIGGEYRKRFEDGQINLTGSVTNSDLVGVNNDDKGKSVRGFILGRGRFDIDENWRWGFDIYRASDRRYLREFYRIRDDILNSRAFVEGFHGRNYTGINAYAFQDMRFGNSTQEPLVLPSMVYSAFGEPGGTLGGRWSFDADLRSIHRDGGPNSTRFVARPGWRRELVSGVGLITTVEASAMVAFHAYDDYDGTDDSISNPRSGDEVRLFPRGSVEARYPFVRYGETTQQVIEPKVALSFAPSIDNEDVPNEDSIAVSFDTSNLFLPSRYAGLDRLDTGVQVTYGVKWGIQGYESGEASVFVGQTYHLTDENDYPVDSGLSRKASDFVSRLTLQPASWLDIDYRNRFDSESLRARVHSVTASVGDPDLTLWGNYSFRDQAWNSARNALTHSSYAGMGVYGRLNENWSLGVAHTQAFSSDPGPRATGATLSYQDECLLFQTVLQRDFTSTTGDEEEGTSMFFRLVFKNLGEFKSPNFGSLVFPTKSEESN